MRMTCPSCGAIHSAEAWVNDANARQCLLVVAELPAEVGKRVLPYLALFRPSASGRALTWAKALRLLSELSGMVTDSHIQWDKSVARPNLSAAWAEALEQIVQRPPARLPLTSHGYLRRIAYDFADRRDRARERSEVRNLRSNCQRSEVGGQRSETAKKRTEEEGRKLPEKRFHPGPEDFKKLREVTRGIGEKI